MSISYQKKPWRVAPGPFLDGSSPCRRYAARIVETGAGLVLLGFVDRPDGETFVGEVSDPDPVDIDQNGYLHVRAGRPAAE